ncbi:251_t:CDS:2, partial [Funneliformis mosseae]
AKVEALLLQESFETLYVVSVIYLTIEDNILPPYDKVKSGYISIRGLKALKVLNMDRELPLDYTQEEIEENLNKLKSKLKHPITEVDINLYGLLKQSLAGIESSDLTWRDLEASIVLSDNSDIVKNLGSSQKNIFMELREKMKCVLPDSVVAKYINFVKVFNNTKNAGSMKNILHNKKWKESETDLVKITERILGIIISHSEQSEETYIADVIIPLLRTSLSDLPNGAICLNTAKCQSITSKARRNLRIIGEWMGKKPDIMGLLEQNEKIIELLYTESSRI